MTYSTALRACERSGDYARAVAVWERLHTQEGVEPNHYSYASFINTCGRKGHWQQVSHRHTHTIVFYLIS